MSHYVWLMNTFNLQKCRNKRQMDRYLHWNTDEALIGLFCIVTFCHCSVVETVYTLFPNICALNVDILHHLWSLCGNIWHVLVRLQMNIELKSTLCYVWLYILALHSIVSVLSCVTVGWFCCSVLTATIIQTNIIIICPIAIAYSMDRL